MTSEAEGPDTRPGLPWPGRVAVWDRALAAVRDHFRGQGLREVSTPVRLGAVAIEPYIEPIGSGDRWLATSPELPMKQLLCRGSGSIFQIAHCFRASERGSRHRPEFHLVEWYRLGDDPEPVLRDVEHLVAAVGAAAAAALHRPPPSVPSWTSILFTDAVRRTAQIDLRGDETAAQLHAAVARVSPALAAPLVARSDVWPTQAAADLYAWTAFFTAWSDACFDPWQMRNPGQGVHLHGFPPALAALARVDEPAGGPAVARRFESYVGGLELSNGYVEATDPAVLRGRFAAAAALREPQAPALPMPDSFFSDLEVRGLVPCTGVALGLDRLLMHAVGATDLADISLHLGAAD